MRYLFAMALALFISVGSLNAGDPKTVPTTQMTKTIVERKNEQMLYTLVRVRSSKATGSGTIIYSEDREKDGRVKSFILTNHHVVEDAIKIEQKWNNLLGKYENVEVLDRVNIDVFRYTPDGQENGRVQYDADIVAYEKDEDLALLQLTVGVPMDYVAHILPKEEPLPRVFDRVYAVGCSLSHAPLPTAGEITSLNKDIDRKPYWMISAPIVFGNSGGAVFLERPDGYWWIGVPSRVASTGSQVIPHMAYIVPLTRIQRWLREQRLTFLIDVNVTPEQCFKDRDALRSQSKPDPTLKAKPNESPLGPLPKSESPEVIPVPNLP